MPNKIAPSEEDDDDGTSRDDDTSKGGIDDDRERDARAPDEDATVFRIVTEHLREGYRNFVHVILTVYKELKNCFMWSSE